MAIDSSKRGTPRKATPRKAPAARPSGRAVARPAKPAARKAKATPLRASKAQTGSLRPAKAQKPLIGLGSSTKASAKGAPKNAAKAARASQQQGQVPSFLVTAAKGGSPADVLGTRNKPASGREARERHQRAGSVKLVGGIVAGVCALGLIALIVFFVLRDSSVFSVDQIIIEPTEHVSQSDAANLLHVEDGTTLLNFDKADIENQLKRDPWVGSVSVERQFPHTLSITIEEQSIAALVVMNSGSMGWYLGTSGSWIEPVKIEVADGESVNDAALAVARAQGVLLITGVPATVEPKAGSEATDDVLSAVSSFCDGFSSDFLSQIVSFDASSSDAVSCVMQSGVKVSLGSAANISYKEQVAAALLEKYAGQITYINVRTPSSASVRRVGTGDVTQGTGADGASATSGDAASTSASAGETTDTDSGSASEEDSSADGGSADDSGDEGAYTGSASDADGSSEPAATLNGSQGASE